MAARGRQNARQLRERGTLSMRAGGEYALRCLGLATAAIMGEGIPVYVRPDKDMRQALVRFYFPDDIAEDYVDLGPDVREEVAAMLEAAFTAKLANLVYEACGDRPAETPPEGRARAIRGGGGRKTPIGPENGSEGP